MTIFNLIELQEKNKPSFKKDMQDAFQYGFEVEYGKSDELILPDEDIEMSLASKGAKAYQAVMDNKVVGGTIVVINEETQHNHLDLLFVRTDCQSKGVGQMIWNEIERMFPKTKVWETCTPYFEKRNIHFYVNRCKFHIVEFYNPHNPDPDTNGKPSGGMPEGTGDYFFRFEKVMNSDKKQ